MADLNHYLEEAQKEEYNESVKAINAVIKQILDLVEADKKETVKKLLGKLETMAYDDGYKDCEQDMRN